MARHAKKTSTAKRVVATSSLFAVAGPLAMVPATGWATDARCEALDDGLTGVVATSLDNYVCQVTFTQTQANPWELPAEVTKLSVLGIAGGGGALGVSSLGYAGGGGQLNYVDNVSLSNRNFAVTIGAAGTNASAGTSAGNGGNTTLVNGASTVILTAGGGFGGNSVVGSNSAYQFRQDGQLGSSIYLNNPAGATAPLGGAGTGSNLGASGAAGTGHRISGEITNDGGGVDYLDPVLWDEDITNFLSSGFTLKMFRFGAGGSAQATAADNRIAGSGGGANVSNDGATRNAAGSGILIMRFVIPAPTFDVVFNANQGAGSMGTQTASSATALTSNSFTRSGFAFTGWNTAADGSGTAYADGASYAFTANTTLYAQWVSVAPPVPTPYSGPLPVSLSGTCLAGTGGTLTLSGERLTGITGATVDGKAATVSEVTGTSLKVTFPALAAGTYDVTYQSPEGSITHQDSLRVCATTASSVPVVTPAPETGAEPGTPVANQRLYVYKRFSNYRGDRGPVVAADRRAITAFIQANPGLTHVTCVGSTSGVPAIETDQALATARANNACEIVESLVPGVKTRIATNTGLGVGQFFRAVTLFGTGLKSN